MKHLAGAVAKVSKNQSALVQSARFQEFSSLAMSYYRTMRHTGKEKQILNSGDWEIEDPAPLPKAVSKISPAIGRQDPYTFGWGVRSAG